MLPSLYGLETGPPLLPFAVLIVFGAKSVTKTLNKLKEAEWWTHHATGCIFIIMGFYYYLVYFFGILGSEK